MARPTAPVELSRVEPLGSRAGFRVSTLRASIPRARNNAPLAGGSSLIAGVGSTPVSGSQCLAGLPLDRRRLLGKADMGADVAKPTVLTRSGRRVRCTQALIHCRYVGDLRSFRSDGKGAIMISHRTKQLIGLCSCFWLLAVGSPINHAAADTSAPSACARTC